MHHCSIDDALHDRGYRKTHPRHRIIELFQQSRAWGVNSLQRQLHDVARATIYRTLRLLLCEGVIVPVRAINDETVYEKAHQAHHDHLTCTKCATVECLPCPVPTIETHILEITGTCSTCRT